jgi:AcrR family transcriptional regulator
MIAEIKAVARQHLATDGANLSLRAVTRDMGMVSSALYRYFASRDELLTALIMDAYNDLGDQVAAADAGIKDRSRLRARWLESTRAVRRWALANPAEYALIYGSPVPGYAAPAETIAAAARTPALLARILTDGYAAGSLTAGGAGTSGRASTGGAGQEPASGTGAGVWARAGLPVHLAAAVRADLTAAAEGIAAGLPAELLGRGLTGWIQMFGAVSLELFGQFNNVIEAREEFFDLQMELMADLAGLPPGR